MVFQTTNQLNISLLRSELGGAIGSGFLEDAGTNDWGKYGFLAV